VGFDGAIVANTGTATDSSLSGFPYTGWTWRSDRQTGTDPVTITVTTVGLHTLDIWQREDGTLVDKIIIEPANRGSATAAPAPATANGGLGEGETWDFQVAPPAAPTVSFSSPTNNQAFAANSSIVLSAAITAPSPLTLVEFFEGTNKLGQTTSAPYTFTVTNATERIYSFSARVTDSIGYVVTSPTARVVVDSTKPVMQAVASSFDGKLVGVLFKEQVAGLDPVSATNAANYQINNGAIAVTSAALQPDNFMVVLTPATPVTGQFTVKAQNVADLGYGPNVMTATTLTGSVVTNLITAQDVGTPNATTPGLFTDPIMPGFTLALDSTDFYIAAGGSDIWNNADGCQFLFQEKTGNFDVAARIESLTSPDVWSKASIMVREDLEGGSRNLMILTAPTNGQNLLNFQWRAVKNGASGSLDATLRPTPSPIPNCWLRLQRTNDLFSGYYGTNGTDWTLLFSTNITVDTYPAKTYVGIAVTSHNNGANVTNTVRALIRDVRGLVAANVVPVKPTLTVKKSSTNVLISWTSDSSRFTLQSSSAIFPTNWQPVNATPTVAGNVYTVTLPIGTGTQFYRAIAP